MAVQARTQAPRAPARLAARVPLRAVPSRSWAPQVRRLRFWHKRPSCWKQAGPSEAAHTCVG